MLHIHCMKYLFLYRGLLQNPVSPERATLLRFQYSPHAIIGAIKDTIESAGKFTIWETGKFNK